MKVLVIDNDFEGIPMQPIRRVLTELCGGLPRSDLGKTYTSSLIQQEKPDVLLVDIALSSEEEKELEGNREPEANYCSRLSGIAYCQRVKGDFPHLPVVLMSQFDRSNVIATCLEAGADGFLPKNYTSEPSIRAALKAAYFKGKTQDVLFFEALSALLANGQCWRQNEMQNACRSFFDRGSAGRRLVSLWAGLAPLVIPAVDETIITKLISMQVDTEAILLGANPSVRDHLRHSGNVFWLGYYLLNAVESIRRNPPFPFTSHPDFKMHFAEAADHLHCAWILAALLHDTAYLRDGITSVETRLNHGRAFFGLSKVETGRKSGPFPTVAMEKLKGYLRESTFGDNGKELAKAIEAIEQAWGEPVGSRPQFVDHGISAAAALLDQVGSAEVTGEVMHAAAAIALHNMPKWATDLKLSDAARLPFSLLPCANLLALCDDLQGWGREPVGDPLSCAGKDIRGLSDLIRKAYVEGSRISSYTVGNKDGKGLIDIAIQYSMNLGEGQASNDLRTDIIKWREKRGPSVQRVLCLNDLFNMVRITHLIPDDNPNPEIVFLAGQSA